MIKEHGFLFKREMILAILEDRKTMTRRVVTPRNSLFDGHGYRKWPVDLDWSTAFVDGGPSPAGNPGPYWIVRCPSRQTSHRIYPRIQVGDSIWARERWWCWGQWAQMKKEDKLKWRFFDQTDEAHSVIMDADLDGEPEGKAITRTHLGYHKRPSVFMPRRVARIEREVREVVGQRIQKISEKDARAEGICVDPYGDGRCIIRAIPAFCNLWDGINGEKYPWKDNPPVWGYRWENPG